METEIPDTVLEADLMEVVEAILFVSDDPVPSASISNAYGEVTGQTGPSDASVEGAVNRLNEIYAETGRIFRIHRWGGGFQMATEPRVDPFLRVLVESRRVRKMSRSLLETLAVVAYRQPISKPEVDSVRGVDAGYALRKLLELGFVEIIGRSETVGRPLLYGTNEQFLVQFGLDSLTDLPKLKELDELMRDPELHFPRDEGNGSPNEGMADDGSETQLDNTHEKEGEVDEPQAEAGQEPRGTEED